MDKDFLKYKRANFKSLGNPAFLIYVSLAFVDSNSFGGGLGLFLLIRFVFVLPTLAFSHFSQSFNEDGLDLAIIFSFFWAALGVSITSNILGGIESDYYFGLVIVSFVQYSFTPLSLKKTILLDIVCVSVFFFLNTTSFQEQQELIIKQLSNYMSFIILKYLVVNHSKRLIQDALIKVTLEEELKNKKNLQSILGELCHLFNNPLFISLSLLKRLKKSSNDIETRQTLEKVIESNQRMEKVVERMLYLQASESTNSVNVDSFHETKKD